MENEQKILKINLDDILPNRFQPRIKFDEDSLNELAESIKEHGVIQPVIVRPIGDKFEIIAGERRYKASLIAGKDIIPAIVSNLDDRESAEIALIENVQRQDLTPIEEAVSYKKILNMGYLTQEELAAKIDKKQSTISNKLRLLNLGDEVQEALLNDKISERHARSLLRLNNEDDQRKILDRIINERLTVRKTDQIIDEFLGNTSNNEEKVEKMNNEYGNLNIPVRPIINDEIEEISFDDIIEDEDLNEVVKDEVEKNIDVINTTSNPGFLNIDEIKENAQDINIERPLADIDQLLKKDENIPVEEIPKKEEEPMSQNFNKFFNFPISELNEEEVSTTFGTSDVDVNKEETNQSNMLDGFNFEPDIQPTINEKSNLIPNNNAPIIEPTIDMNPVTQGESNELDLSDDFYVNLEKEINSRLAQIDSDPINDLNIGHNLGMGNLESNLETVIQPNVDFNIPAENVDFKIVINTIRECANKIEKEGFVVEKEELDFENYYQVTIKVNKK